MKGYDEYNTILLPPRTAGDRLPHELTEQYYADLKIKEDNEKMRVETVAKMFDDQLKDDGTSPVSDHSQPGGADGGGGSVGGGSGVGGVSVSITGAAPVLGGAVSVGGVSGGISGGGGITGGNEEQEERKLEQETDLNKGNAYLKQHEKM